MEGYTNVIGSSYDFDDLDIEGRVVDEWNADEDEKLTSKNINTPSKHLNEKAILNERVKLDNGKQADVFSVVRKQDNVWYTCHVCSDTVVGLVALQQHVDSGKHKTNMSQPVHPCAKFIKIDPKENLALEPGEPVPPGLEETIIKNALIQPKLDAYKVPLIGLEFMVELTESTLDETEYYYCLLCEKTGSERNMFIHFTSIFHYMKYLSMYFPTVARKLQSLPNKKMKKAFGLVVTDIIRDIEEKLGRLKPRSVTYDEFHFQGRKNELLKAAFEGPHFKEIDGGKFDEKATAENVDKKNKEVIAAPPVMMKTETPEKPEEKKEGSGITFNKSNRIGVDKKQLRSREEDKRNSSPDVQIINVQQKSPDKKRTRSKSLSSLSSISSSSSHSRNKARYHAHSRHHSKPTGRRNWSRSRSRSRSPGYQRHRRYDRWSPGRYSPGRRSRSPRRSYHHYHRSRHDSRGHSPDPYRMRVDRYGRQIREKHDNRTDRYHRERTPDGRGSPKEDRPVSAEEKVRWEKFREELTKVEAVKLEKLKYHEKNPEKHPQYPEEWKAFWNRRYNELQRSGVDPSKHDFKPEWIAFWTKRMKELYEDDLSKAKEELKKKFDLPEDPGNNTMPWKYHQRKQNSGSPGLVDISPPTPEKKDVIADIKTTWKAFTGSDIKDTPKRPLSPWEEEQPSLYPPRKRKQSPSLSPTPYNEKLLENMPQRKSRTSALIFVLRKLTVLEQQLGSLAPKTFELMSQSLALEKLKEDGSLDLLLEEENSVYLETVREKLIALLCAGVVPRHYVNTARSAIKNTDIALYIANKRERSIPVETVRAVMGGVLPSNQSVAAINPFPTVQPLPKSEPLVVPGIGQVDKVSVAQQIATALVEQGKTNVTEGELEQLINAVVGMAEASAHSAQPMTTAYFLQRLQAMQNPTVPNVLNATPMVSVTAPSLVKAEPDVSRFNHVPLQTSVVKPSSVASGSQPSAAFGALKLLQSAYNETSKADLDSPKPDIVEVVPSNAIISDTELASTLSVFNKMTKEDQPNFVSRLKTTNPEMYKRLCPFIPKTVIAAADNPTHSPVGTGNTKRSPINIPISKERSEQKIKPPTSGRLSPFSQRSGSTNPTISDKVVIDDDDDDNDKNDVNIVSESQVKQPSYKGNLDLSKYKSNESDLDDDDDDDYSYEDVYKAAQEKLRQQQKQVDDDNDKSNLSVALKTNTNTEPKDLSKLNSDNTQLSMSSNNPTWGNPSNPEKPPFPTGESFQQQKQSSEDFRGQQPLYPDANKHNPSRLGQDSSQSSYPYQGAIQERQPSIDPDPYTGSGQPAYGGGVNPSYTNKDHYSNDPYYPKESTDYYKQNSQYPPDSSYSSTKDPYGHPPRDSYTSTYRDSYSAPQYNAQGSSSYGDQNAQGNTTYGNQNTPGNSSYGNQNPQGNSAYGNTYGDQYSYRDTQYGGNNYSQGRFTQAYPNPAAPPSRYPSQRYPPY